MRSIYNKCIEYHCKFNIRDQDTAHSIFKYLESSGEIQPYILSRERIVYTLMYGCVPAMELSPLAILLSAGKNEVIKGNSIYNKLSKRNDTGFNTLTWNYIMNRSNIDYSIFDRIFCTTPVDVDRFYANSAFTNFIKSAVGQLIYNILSGSLDQEESMHQSKIMSLVIDKLRSTYKFDLDDSYKREFALILKRNSDFQLETSLPILEYIKLITTSIYSNI